MAARKPSSPRHCRRECGGSPHGVEHELADGGGWGGSGCSRADPPGQLILDQLVAVSDQLFLGLEVVADGLFGDLGLARHVADGDLLILVERRLAVMGLGDRFDDFNTLARTRTSVGLEQRIPQEWARSVCS